MIGQQSFINTVNNLTRLPQTVLLLGDIGSEFEEAVGYIADRFNLTKFELDYDDRDEWVEKLKLAPVPTLYILDGNTFGIKSELYQNRLLKALEEPMPFSYILVKGNNKKQFLETVLNRSHILQLKNLTRHDLMQVSVDANILNICTTVGQAEQAQHYNLKELNNTCMKLAHDIKDMKYHEILAIANKINFTNEEEKYPLWLFVRTLKNYVQDVPSYLIIKEFDETVPVLTDKKRYFETCMSDLWYLNKK